MTRWILPFLAFITALAIVRASRRPSFVETSDPGDLFVRAKPKSTRTVQVHLNYVGRGKPKIFLDDPLP